MSAVSWLRNAGVGIWDFVVGDDWRTAIGVVVAFGVAAAVAAAGIAAWWVMPIAVPLLLLASLWRVARDARDAQRRKKQGRAD
ncbi:MAG TPA: hypothetical protein VGF95_15215 [Solirubrobacteraceae bacterium]